MARLWRDKVRKAGVLTHESDLKPAAKYLMDKGVFARISMTKPKFVRQRPGLVQWIDPDIAPNLEPTLPDFSTMSIDIETGKQGQLFSIAIHHHSRKAGLEVRLVMLRKRPEEVPKTAGIELQCFESEKDMLLAFIQTVQELDPDIIMGWNVVGFDLDFLLNKMRRFGISPRLGRNNSLLRLFRTKMGLSAATHGRVVIDVPRALRSNFFYFDRFGLDYVAQEVLGEGKLIANSHDKWQEIERQYYHEPDALVRYNMQDSVLVSRIAEKTGIMQLLSKRSMISGMLMPRVGGSTAAFDHQLIPALHKAGFVVPDLADVTYLQSAKGGHVFSPEAGLHKHVVVLDFRSLYPSIIKTFHIDPLSILMRDQDPIETPVGINFSRKHHALPEIITGLFAERLKAKSNGDAQLSQAVKILMNSFYGVMGSKGCRFYHRDLPDAITGVGRYILNKAKQYLEQEGYAVIYGDTDSVFVCLKPEEAPSFAAAGQGIARALNTYFTDYIRERYDLESHLQMEYEKYYRDFFLPPPRQYGAKANPAGEKGALAGSKKRYVGMAVKAGQSPSLIFTGMEYVRSDWTKLAKDFQWTLYQMLFTQKPVDEWIRSQLDELRQGRLDADLAYKKRLTKPPHEYVKAKPPHVRAALKLLEVDPTATLRYVRYFMTSSGPVPIELEPVDIDYEHYIHKQLKPIADTILPYFGASFDQIVSQGGTQPALF